jgi:hypothetical protein
MGDFAVETIRCRGIAFQGLVAALSRDMMNHLREVGVVN